MSDFYGGQKVEYYSPSYAEWIECKIGAVRPDGKLKLEHIDGTGVLKESADASRVRPFQGAAGKEKENGKPPSGSKAGAPSSKASPSPLVRGKSAGPGAAPSAPPAVPKKAPSSAGAPSPTPGDATPGRRPSASPAPPVPKASSGTPRVSGSSATPRQKAGPSSKAAGSGDDNSIYVGDRVKLKGPPVRFGEVMYIGAAQFAGNETVVGVKLDEKRSSSDCDGSYKGERFFRCQPGHGIYQAFDEVELVPPDLADEDVRSLVMSPPPDAESFDLEQELEGLIGLREIKDSVRHTRNFVEVQRRRCNVTGDASARALHFAFMSGTPGSGASSVARLLAGMLLKLGVLSVGQVVEATKKDLLAGCSGGGDVETKLKKVAKAADGGVLLISGADMLRDPEKSSDRLGEEALQAVSKLVEGNAGQTEWPQRLCIVLAGRRSELSKLFMEQSSLGSSIFAKLEFSDLTAMEVAMVLRRLVEANKFQLCADLTDEKLELLVRRRMARAGGGDGPGAAKNVRLAKAMLEEAVTRQTDRVWAKETLSFTGLTALKEEDFVDKNKEMDEAAQAALKKLEGIVGLRPVKEFVRSLYATLQMEQRRHEMGLEKAGGGPTLHMVFQGNPGTGKTTVARVVADLLKALGLLRTGHMIEADRAALVAGFSGQTALKTKAVVESALGGVLFVDEAYALVGEDGRDSFGREALDTLIKMVEDYRQDLVVILAGYSSEMARLIEANPGLRSRFPTIIEFDDYTAEELLEIADRMLLQDVMILSNSASERLKAILHSIVPKPGAEHDRQAGNGRAVRNILERARRNQALRLQKEASGGKVHSQEELCTLVPEDFEGCTG